MTEVPETTYRLVFDDPEHAGMQVRVRAMSLGDWEHAAFDLAWLPEDDIATRRAKQHELHAMFIDHLVGWDLTRKGKPVAPTIEGLRSLEPKFVGLLVGTWKVGRSEVPAPLEQPSDGGQSDLEASIPMANLSDSRAS